MTHARQKASGEGSVPWGSVTSERSCQTEKGLGLVWDWGFLRWAGFWWNWSVQYCTVLGENILPYRLYRTVLDATVELLLVSRYHKMMRVSFFPFYLERIGWWDGKEWMYNLAWMWECIRRRERRRKYIHLSILFLFTTYVSTSNVKQQYKSSPSSLLTTKQNNTS